MGALMLITSSMVAFADLRQTDELEGPILCDPLTDPEWVIEEVPTSPTAQLMPFAPSASRAIDSVSVIKGSALFAESNHGAHYYAFTSQSTAYTEIFVNVKLPTQLKTSTASGTRRAFISLGIHGDLRGVDLALKNDGDRWMPWFYDPNGGAGGGFVPSYAAPSTATNAVMTAKPVNETTVEVYVRYTDASGNTVGDPFWRQIVVGSGNFSYVNGRINCKFYRFASLVPNPAPDNQMDSTYMLGGQFTNCQIYNGSNYVAWGIGSSMMTNVWKVSPERMTLTYSGTTDSFGIDHWST